MTLDQRVGQLERRCRRLTGVLLGITAVFTVFVVGGAAPNSEAPGTLRSEQLDIVDAEGQVRIRLGKADAGYGVVVYDEQGRHRATLTDAPGGAVMSVSKNGCDIRLMAGEDSAGISVRDSNGNPRAVVVVTKERSQIALKDAKGKTVFFAPNPE